jgi:hypothetical protein
MIFNPKNLCELCALARVDLFLALAEAQRKKYRKNLLYEKTP